MGLSPEVIQRINRLGFVTEDDLKFWQSIWADLDEPAFRVFLRKEEEAAEQYRCWFPRLQEFATECRRKIPVPNSESFSAAEREQYRILLDKMRKFVESGDCRCVFSGKPNHVALLSTTRVGLVAEKVFGGRGALILLQSEREQWFRDICPIDLEAHWWYSFAWWTIMTWEERLVRENDPIPEGWIPEGCSYWFVESGVQWGSLAGGADEELWKWDGERADFIEVCSITSY
jgi:hypothetical protein